MRVIIIILDVLIVIQVCVAAIYLHESNHVDRREDNQNAIEKLSLIGTKRSYASYYEQLFNLLGLNMISSRYGSAFGIIPVKYFTKPGFRLLSAASTLNPSYSVSPYSSMNRYSRKRPPHIPPSLAYRKYPYKMLPYNSIRPLAAPLRLGAPSSIAIPSASTLSSKYALPSKYFIPSKPFYQQYYPMTVPLTSKYHYYSAYRSLQSAREYPHITTSSHQFVGKTPVNSEKPYHGSQSGTYNIYKRPTNEPNQSNSIPMIKIGGYKKLINSFVNGFSDDEKDSKKKSSNKSSKNDNESPFIQIGKSKISFDQKSGGFSITISTEPKKK